MGGATPTLSADAPEDAQSVAELRFRAVYGPQRSLRFVLGVCGFLLILWGITGFDVVQRFLRVGPMQVGVAVAAQMLGAVGASFAARAEGGLLGRTHRLVDRVETFLFAASAVGLIVASGSASSFFWFLTVAHILHNANDALTSRFLFRAHASALLGGAALFAARGQLADATMLVFGAAVVLFTGGARTQALWAQMQLEAERNRLLRQVAELSVQRERQRIARDLHDGPASHLAAIAWGADALALGPAASAPELREQLRELSERARQGMTDLRDVAQGLVHTDTSVEALLRALEQGSALPPGCALRFSSSGEGTLRPAVYEQLLLAGREALLNAARHARASEVHVTLSLDEQRLTLCVQDNGRGLPQYAARRSTGGLRNLHERAERIGGQLTVASGQGACITLVVPRTEALAPPGLRTAEA